MYLKCFLLLSASILVAALQAPALHSRIIGGADEVIENAPWQISLQYQGKHFCGGSIYNADIIITAAHCLEAGPPEEYTVRVGSSKHNEGGTLVKVAAFLKHKGFNKPQYSNDIAVVRLSESLCFGCSVQAIPLAKQIPKAWTQATATGWGYTERTKSPTNLQSVQLNIKNQALCYIFNLGTVTKEMICAIGWLKGVCSGDSGGPLVVNGELVGVSSFTWVIWGTCTGPSVFANVPVLRNWILEAVEKISK